MRDALNRVSTITDQDGYTMTLQWDNFDRLTRRSHPDGTYEEWTYNRLDPASYHLPAIAARMDVVIGEGHAESDWTVLAKDALAK